EPYAPDDGDMTYVAQDEIRRGARRELAGPLPDLSGYGTVFLGTPVWWGSLPPPVSTFLKDRPLAGKRVLPFFTSGSSRPGGAVALLRRLCPQARVEPEFWVPGSDAPDSLGELRAWLKARGF
ncbi:MAG: flavodoxin, partial [Duodenibacillus sp.]|nr:flavodoxin [Duodenibacillus sp.]